MVDSAWLAFAFALRCNSSSLTQSLLHLVHPSTSWGNEVGKAPFSRSVDVSNILFTLYKVPPRVVLACRFASVFLLQAAHVSRPPLPSHT